MDQAVQIGPTPMENVLTSTLKTSQFSRSYMAAGKFHGMRLTGCVFSIFMLENLHSMLSSIIFFHVQNYRFLLSSPSFRINIPIFFPEAPCKFSKPKTTISRHPSQVKQFAQETPPWKRPNCWLRVIVHNFPQLTTIPDPLQRIAFQLKATGFSGPVFWGNSVFSEGFLSLGTIGIHRFFGGELMEHIESGKSRVRWGPVMGVPQYLKMVGL